MNAFSMRTQKGNQQTATLTVTGEIADEAVVKLKNKIDDLFNEGLQEVILDLRKIEYICSSAVAFLYNAILDRKKSGRRIGILSPPEKVRLVFNMFGNVSDFNMADSMNELAEKTGIGQGRSSVNRF